MENTQLEFSALPLQRVAIKLAPSEFLPVSPRTLHFLLLHLKGEWTQSRFIEVEEPGFGRACLEMPLEYTFTSRGFQFRNPTRNLVLTYQANLLGVEWQYHEGAEYVRFPVLKEVLAQLVEVVTDLFGSEHPLSFHACNMGYLNFVTTQDFPTGKDVARYLKSSFRFPALDQANLLHEQNVCWKEACGTDYRIHLKSGSREEDGDEDEAVGIELHTTAGRMFDSAPGFPTQELDLVHELLNTRFHSALTANAKKEWRLA